MSRVDQVRAMPPEGLRHARVAQEAVVELLDGAMSEAVKRQLTIDMWVRIGMRYYLKGGLPDDT